LWTWLLKKVRPKIRLYVFAHNWGFDACVVDLFNRLPLEGWRIRHAVIESPPVILTWRKAGASITFLDTLNWWRVPLRELGRSVGVPKLEMPSPDAAREAWDRYARADVEIIRTALHHWLVFLRAYDLGGFASTLAGQAFRSFRHRFMLHPILIDDNQGALDLARRALHGGRVEAFHLGRVETPVHHFDVNSMYPAVMRDHEYPSIHRLTARNCKSGEVERWLSYGCVVAEVLVTTPEPVYPVFHEHRLLFPVGTFWTHLSSPEVAYALEHDHVREIRVASVYDRAPLFRSFIEELYALRRQARERGNEVQTYLLKILMNSLYGKFAQAGQVWNYHGVADSPAIHQWKEIDADTGEVSAWRQFSGIVQRRSREGESLDSHPAIAAHVTAHARMKLWALMKAAGRENVLYCDTDSLFVRGVGAGQLAGHVDDSRLGALKLEGVYPWAVFRGLKDYETPEHTVVKGDRRTAKWIGPNSVSQESWARLPGLLRAGGLSAPTTSVVTKVLHRVYTKGEVQPDGRVLPWTLGPGE
jgi:hypothetical protein